MKITKQNIAIGIIGWGISSLILGAIESKRRERDFKRSMDQAAKNATATLKRSLQTENPYFNAGAYGVKTAMEMENDRKNTPVAWANYPDGRRVGINADGEEIPE
ncbi:MAG: hypothetical protein J6U28_08640 [Bacteroidales bacterium]|nr:hypothetical protein [Bacteroidales bacterium]MBP5775041.1 hypothetical protein [Clostridiales bacterium]